MSDQRPENEPEITPEMIEAEYKEPFLRAVRDELIEHFRWTSVEGLVELEANSIAWSAFERFRDGLTGQTEAQKRNHKPVSPDPGPL